MKSVRDSRVLPACIMIWVHCSPPSRACSRLRTAPASSSGGCVYAGVGSRTAPGVGASRTGQTRTVASRLQLMTNPCAASAGLLRVMSLSTEVLAMPPSNLQPNFKHQQSVLMPAPLQFGK